MDEERDCSRDVVAAFIGVHVLFDDVVEYHDVPAYATIYGRHSKEFNVGMDGRMHANAHEAADVHELAMLEYRPFSAFGPEGEL